MGRRSRKRAASTASERPAGARPPVRAATPQPRTAPRRRRGRGEPPPAPWGKFPLVELCVLIAIVLGVIGFLSWGPRGRVMVACAAALGSLAGLELSIREHFAGYRSHTTVLAATVAIAAIALMFFARVPQVALLAVGAAIFATAFFVLRELFKRRSGGFGFR